MPFTPFKRKKVGGNKAGSRAASQMMNNGAERANQLMSLGIHNIQEDYDNEGSQYNGSQRHAPISAKRDIENSKDDQIVER